MKSFYNINLEIRLGADIKETCLQALQIARLLNQPVTFKFNTVPMLVKPEDDTDGLVHRYSRSTAATFLRDSTKALAPLEIDNHPKKIWEDQIKHIESEIIHTRKLAEQAEKNRRNYELAVDKLNQEHAHLIELLKP